MDTSQDVNYWEKRYYNGGHSGYGSKGKLLTWKAEIINQYIKYFDAENVVEVGCGDGNLAAMLKCKSYTGHDISKTALKIAAAKRTGKFVDALPDVEFDIALSIDVIHHITDKKDLKEHLNYLKKHKHFIIYAPKSLENPAPHCSNLDWRKILRRKPLEQIENKFPYTQFGSVKGSHSEFFIYAG